MTNILSTEFSRFYKESVSNNQLRVIETMDLDVDQRLLNEDRFHDLSVYCDTATITSDLKFPGKHLLINCRELILNKNFTIDTSVDDNDLKYFDWGTPRLKYNTIEFLEEIFKEAGKNPSTLYDALRSNITASVGNAIAFDDGMDAIRSLNRLLGVTQLYESCIKVPKYNPLLKKAGASLTALEKQTALLRTRPVNDLDAQSLQILRRFNREIIATVEKANCPAPIFVWHDYTLNKQAQHGKPAEVLTAGKSGANGFDGANGAHGSDGIDAGNVTIVAESITFGNGSVLMIKANGGNGGRGQYGGNGSDGGDASIYEARFTRSSATITLENGSQKVTFDFGAYIKSKKDGFFSPWEDYMADQAGFEKAVAPIVPKGGKGGNGGNAGNSGSGGNGGIVKVFCIQNSAATQQHIQINSKGGIAPERTLGGKAGKSGEPSIFKLGVGRITGGAGLQSFTYYESTKGSVPATSNGTDGTSGVIGKDGYFKFETIDYSQLFYPSTLLQLKSIGANTDLPFNFKESARKLAGTDNSTAEFLLTDIMPDAVASGLLPIKESGVLAIPVLTNAAKDYIPCSTEQRLMTLYALKLAYLKNDLARTSQLLNWLENVTPAESFSDEVTAALSKFLQLVLPDQPATGTRLFLVNYNNLITQNSFAALSKQEFDSLVQHAASLLATTQELGFARIIRGINLGSAIHHQVLLLKNYMACGLDFHGHAPNYTPLFKVEHYTDRIGKILNVARSVEQEFNKWSAIAADADRELNFSNAFVSSANDKLRSLDLGINELLERRKQMENILEDLTRELKAEFKVVESNSQEFFRQVQQGIGFEISLGLLNVIAQTVLIGTGNVAAAKYVGMAGTGVEKLQGYLQGKKAGEDDVQGGKNPFLQVAGESFSRHAASMKKLEEYQRQKNKKTEKLKAEIIKQDDESNLTIAVSSLKEKKPETGFMAKVKSGGEQVTNIVAHVMPIATEVQNLQKLFKNLEESNEKLSFDAIKLAMTSDTYDELFKQFAKYADAGLIKRFRESIGKFEQLAGKRNNLQLEFTALFIKMQELVASGILVNQEIAVSKENIALNENPVIRQMSLFWQNVYDYFRDLLLDNVYEEFQAYRYASLSDASFSVVSFSHYLTESTVSADQKQLSDSLAAARRLDQLYVNQNLSFIDLLHNRVYEMAIRARESKFGSHAILEGEAGQIVFKKTNNNELFLTETDYAIGVFVIPEDIVNFSNRAHLSFSELRVFFPGIRTNNGRVSLKIRHGGQVFVKDKKGISHSYLHDIPNIVDYEYKAFDAAREKEISRLDRRKIVYQDERDIYVDYITNSLGNDDIYIELNPCTQWTVYVSANDNPGINLKEINEVIFQFKARALSMDVV